MAMARCFILMIFLVVTRHRKCIGLMTPGNDDGSGLNDVRLRSGLGLAGLGSGLDLM